MTTSQITKLKDIILYILKDFSGGTDYIKLYKILYFANKEHLAETGIPIIHDNFKAWDLGPVPSFTGALVKKLELGEPLKGKMKSFEGALKVKKKKVMATIEPNLLNIPEYTKNLLDALIPKYKYQNSKNLSRLSHDIAWYEAYYQRGGSKNGKEIINPVWIARSANADEKIINLIDRLYDKNQKFVKIIDDSYTLDKFEMISLEMESLSQMEEGWDGEDASAITKESVYNCRYLLSFRRSLPQFLDIVYPTPYGTICIDWSKNGNKVSAEVSDKEFGFYFISSDRKGQLDSEIMGFNEENLENLFTNLEKLLA